jgi:hypothetical protein
MKSTVFIIVILRMWIWETIAEDVNAGTDECISVNEEITGTEPSTPTSQSQPEDMVHFVLSSFDAVEKDVKRKGKTNI